MEFSKGQLNEFKNAILNFWKFDKKMFNIKNYF